LKKIQILELELKLNLELDLAPEDIGFTRRFIMAPTTLQQNLQKRLIKKLKLLRRRMPLQFMMGLLQATMTKLTLH
jgi:hypothetical protein